MRRNSWHLLGSILPLAAADVQAQIVHLRDVYPQALPRMQHLTHALQRHALTRHARHQRQPVLRLDQQPAQEHWQCRHTALRIRQGHIFSMQHLMHSGMLPGQCTCGITGLPALVLIRNLEASIQQETAGSMKIIFRALAQGRRTHLLRASISGMMAGSSSASASSFVSSAKEGLVFMIARHRS